MVNIDFKRGKSVWKRMLVVMILLFVGAGGGLATWHFVRRGITAVIHGNQLANLASEDKETRNKALMYFEEMGAAAVDDLRPLMDSDDPLTREKAAEALMLIMKNNALEPELRKKVIRELVITNIYLRPRYEKNLPSYVVAEQLLSEALGWQNIKIQISSFMRLDGDSWVHLAKSGENSAYNGWNKTEKSLDIGSITETTGTHTIEFRWEIIIQYSQKTLMEDQREIKKEISVVDTLPPEDLRAVSNPSLDMQIQANTVIESWDDSYARRSHIRCESLTIKECVVSFPENLKVGLAFKVFYQVMPSGDVIETGQTVAHPPDREPKISALEIRPEGIAPRSAVYVKIILKPSREEAYKDPRITEYWNGTIEQELEITIISP